MAPFGKPAVNVDVDATVRAGGKGPGRAVGDDKMAENVRQLDKKYDGLKEAYQRGDSTWQEMVEQLKGYLDTLLEKDNVGMGGFGERASRGLSTSELTEEDD